jgi:hypothetical protein
MYFCSMNFVFPYKKRTSDFELIQSIRWIRMSFPMAKIFTIGDEIEGVQNIPCPVFSMIRGVDVTNKILTFANQIGGEFIYMNDDFFISPKLRANVPIYNGKLIINPIHPSHYQIACKNSIEFLEYNGNCIYNFETHSPILIDSKKLIKTFDKINWQSDNHFIKSIYLNVNQPKTIRPGTNLKLSSGDIAKAESFLRDYGCFSSSDEFINSAGGHWIKNLTLILERQPYFE